MESPCECCDWQVAGNKRTCVCKILCAVELCTGQCWNCCLGHEVSTSQRLLSATCILNHVLSFDTFSRFFYNTWRPVTAIQSTEIWLSSGLNISSASWTPLLSPTPSHQDYVSTHSTFGGAASAVIRAYNGGDIINATISSNVTLNNRGVITRTFTNLTEAALQNAASRVFGGVSATLLFEFMMLSVIL
jgi:hypothetical protein